MFSVINRIVSRGSSDLLSPLENLDHVTKVNNLKLMAMYRS
jgi:hypothetical protein